MKKLLSAVGVLSLVLVACGDDTGNGGAGGASSTTAAQGSSAQGSTKASSASSTQSASVSATVTNTAIASTTDAASSTDAASTTAQASSTDAASTTVAASSSTGMDATVEIIPCAGLVPDATVGTNGFAFSPNTATVPIGGVVEFAPSGGHTMVSDVAGLFDTVTAGQGTCLRFSVAGSYPFHCGPHPQMMGTVTVQ